MPTASDNEAHIVLLAAGLAALRVAPAGPVALRTDEIEVGIAAASALQLDALAALGVKHLGLRVDDDEGERRRRRARQRAAMFATVTVEVARLLDAAGVRHAFFKGAAADAAYFGGRGLRGTSDVDVLVDDLEGAVAALASVARGEAYEHTRPHLKLARRARTIPVRVHGVDTMVDLQSQWLNDPPLVDDTAGVLARAVREPALGNVMRPAHEDYAAYLGANLVMDRFSGRIKLALDLAMMFALSAAAPLSAADRADPVAHRAADLEERGDVDSPPLIDWPLVVERARAWRVLGALWALAGFVGERFGVAPPEVIRELAPPPLIRRRLLRASVEGAPIPGAFTRAFESDSLVQGALHFARYVPARILDYLADERSRR